MTTLVRGRWVIPGADEAIIDDGAVLVEDGIVAALGSFDELARARAIEDLEAVAELDRAAARAERLVQNV